MNVDNIEDFRALEPIFQVIETGLAGLVDGGHFFGFLAEDVVFEFIITVPDYPRRVVGRDNLIDLYRGYHTAFFLDRCYDLRTPGPTTPPSRSSTRLKVRPLQPDVPTATGTSQSSPSRIARSPTGGTISTRSASSQRSASATSTNPAYCAGQACAFPGGCSACAGQLPGSRSRQEVPALKNCPRRRAVAWALTTA
jgi:hypothetical protein